MDRNVEDLSGGELQRFAIGVVAAQKADVYMFDEPSSYLDVKQRLKAAQVVRSLLHPERRVRCYLSRRLGCLIVRASEVVESAGYRLLLIFKSGAAHHRLV